MQTPKEDLQEMGRRLVDAALESRPEIAQELDLPGPIASVVYLADSDGRLDSLALVVQGTQGHLEVAHVRDMTEGTGAALLASFWPTLMLFGARDSFTVHLADSGDKVHDAVRRRAYWARRCAAEAQWSLTGLLDALALPADDPERIDLERVAARLSWLSRALAPDAEGSEAAVHLLGAADGVTLRAYLDEGGSLRDLCLNDMPVRV